MEEDEEDFVIKYWILRDGEPIQTSDLFEWARWFGDFENRRIALTEITPNEKVSTVFIGGIDGVDLEIPLFETRVFGGSSNGKTMNCKNLEQAMINHEHMVSIVKGE